MADLHSRLVALLRDKSVRTGTFVLASGRTSDLYVDARQTTLHAEGAWLVARLILARLRPEVRAVGGMTLGADPIACAVAALSIEQSRPVHAFLIRKEAKGHGTGNSVEGLANLPQGTKVAIVEDTTTTGGSLIRAARVAKAAGLDVIQCITIVDRQEGATAAVADAGWQLESLTTRSQLLDGT